MPFFGAGILDILGNTRSSTLEARSEKASAASLPKHTLMDRMVARCLS